MKRSALPACTACAAGGGGCCGGYVSLVFDGAAPIARKSSGFSGAVRIAELELAAAVAAAWRRWARCRPPS